MTSLRTAHPAVGAAPSALSGRRTRPAPGLRWAALGVTVISLAGSLLAVATGLNASWWDAVGPTGRLSVPLPMNAFLVLLAVVAAGTRRWLALSAATLLTLACTAAVVSGAFDGGYAAQLTPWQRLAQIALVLGLCGTALLAGRRAMQVVRG